MKQIVKQAILSLAIVLTSATYLLACNACSCNTGNMSMGLLPFDRVHSIGISSQSRILHAMLANKREWTRSNDHEHTDATQEVRWEERHHSTDVRGTYFPTKNLALSAVLPMVFRGRIKEGRTIDRFRGFGDVQLMANTNIISTFQKSDSIKVKHLLTLGSGVILPTGRHDLMGYEDELVPHLQPGTGSVDLLMEATYLMKVSNFGYWVTQSLRLNTRNRNNFRFGHSYNMQLRAFYQKNVKKWQFMPALGANFEMAGLNRIDGVTDELDSSAKVLFASVSATIAYGNVRFLAEYQNPAWQNLAGEQFQNDHRFNFGLTYFIPQNKNKQK